MFRCRKNLIKNAKLDSLRLTDIWIDFNASEYAQYDTPHITEAVDVQSRIMDAYNESLLGKTMDVLVDGYDEELEQFYGRTYADSPEIDGRVWIATQEAITEGSFVKVLIDSVVDGDLSGCLVEE